MLNKYQNITKMKKMMGMEEKEEEADARDVEHCVFKYLFKKPQIAQHKVK